MLPELDAYMGREFERIAVQAYDRLRSRIGLPMVARWGRWEGIDRARESVKIDIVAELASGDVLTGAVKWNREPLGPEVHWRHLDMLQRVAKSGRGWAHQALEPEAPIFYVAAGGFDDRFLDAAERADHPVTCWSIDHLYPEAGTGSEKSPEHLSSDLISSQPGQNLCKNCRPPASTQLSIVSTYHSVLAQVRVHWLYFETRTNKFPARYRDSIFPR